MFPLEAIFWKIYVFLSTRISLRLSEENREQQNLFRVSHRCLSPTMADLFLLLSVTIESKRSPFGLKPPILWFGPPLTPLFLGGSWWRGSKTERLCLQKKYEHFHVAFKGSISLFLHVLSSQMTPFTFLCLVNTGFWRCALCLLDWFRCQDVLLWS